MIRAALAACLCLTSPAAVAQDRVSTGTGALLRALDKLTGEVRDLTVVTGASERFGRITVSVKDCRFPEGNPSGDAFALLEISEVNRDTLAFSGWMVASSPALNALDHARYDVWVLRCTTA